MNTDTLISIEDYERGRKAKPTKRFNITTADTILETDYPPMQEVVPGYVAEGLNLLAGRQKLGKTWLALDWSIAVATGGLAMGAIPCEAADVLYIDLENGMARIKRRLESLGFGPGTGAATGLLKRMCVTTAAWALDKGFIEAAEEWRQTVSRPKLIVIDVFQRVKPIGVPGRNAYENDYAALSELQQWAMDNSIAVVALMHTRKGGADDPLEAVSGSNGMSACADATLVLDKTGDGGVTLYVRGRDIEEKESALKFSEGQWLVQGDADEMRRTTSRADILGVLLTAEEPMTPAAITIATGKKRNAVDQMLYKLRKSGEVATSGRGLYRHTERTDLDPKKGSGDAK